MENHIISDITIGHIVGSLLSGIQSRKQKIPLDMDYSLYLELLL
jgi:hypothetical protein